MTSACESLFELAQQLPAIERAQLVDSLLATLDKPDSDIDALWLKTCHQHAHKVDSGSMETIDFDEALRQLRQQMT